jgi:RNA polymerase sigma-70 factor (ECF subfamily)
LRTVSGLSVAQLAKAFLVSAAAMEQRITRAKRRVAQAALSFETPGPAERAQRIDAVLAMLYLIFNAGYSVTTETAEARGQLCEEAIRLARLLLGLYPTEPEVMGIAALMLLQNSRNTARFDAEGNIVLLEDQDRTRWNREMINEGLALLDKAMRHRRPGTYQVQAAIAALHARAATAAHTDWAGIERLYAALEQLTPSPVVSLNRAVAISKLRGPIEALAAIEPLAEALDGYFYYHGTKGALLAQAGNAAAAREAFGRAMALANSPQEAIIVRQHLDKLQAAPA